jgi:hypothetical protein
MNLFSPVLKVVSGLDNSTFNCGKSPKAVSAAILTALPKKIQMLQKSNDLGTVSFARFGAKGTVPS